MRRAASVFLPVSLGSLVLPTLRVLIAFGLLLAPALTFAVGRTDDDAGAQRGTFGAPPAGDPHFQGPVANFAALPTCSRDGDFRIAMDTKQAYVCSGGVWVAGGAGAPGSKIYNGSAVPSSGLGVSGDYYFRTASYDLYTKSGPTWNILVNLKGADGTTGAAGSQGAQGQQGIQGVPGADGAIGPKGDKGDKGDTGDAGPAGAAGTNGTNGAPGADGIPRTIQDEGVDQPQRGKTNFVGAGVTATDDPANDRTNVTISTPSHASTHQPGGSDPLVVDAAAGTGSLRTLGTGASQAAAGNDGRFGDPRTPTAHASTHKSGGGDEVATATAAASAIPKAGSGGNLDIGWLPLVTPAKGGFGADNSAASGIPVFAAGTATVTATTGTGAPVRATSATLTTPSFSGGIAGDLQFGGTTSSFPMFSRTGNEMKLRNADDSGYTNLRLDRVYTFNGNTIKVQLSGDANSVGLASNSFIFWISSSDVGGAGSGDTGLARGTAGVVTVDTTTAGNAAGTLKATKIQYVPTGGVTCNSAAKGLTYVASGDGTFCACNGTVWSPLPSTGTCN